VVLGNKNEYIKGKFEARRNGGRKMIEWRKHDGRKD
jgi:hypothetical protein